MSVGGEEFAVPDNQGIVDAQVKIGEQLEDGLEFGVGERRFFAVYGHGYHRQVLYLGQVRESSQGRYENG